MKALTTAGLTKLIQLSKDEFLSKNNTTTVTTSGLKTINNTSLLGTGNISITGLPSQSGQSGKYLTTNGTSASWTAFNDSNLVHKTGDETIAGTKTFSSPIKAEIKAGYGGFEYGYGHTGTTAPLYYKILSLDVNGAYQTPQLQFMAQFGQTDKRGVCFGEIQSRTGTTAGIIEKVNTFVLFSAVPSTMLSLFDSTDIRLYYWNNADTNKARIELWVKINSAYNGISFTALDTISSGELRFTDWVFYKNQSAEDWPSDATDYVTWTLCNMSTVAPTENTTTSQQIDTVGARNTKLASYQPLLVSGTNIKTINNTSILGSGNLVVDGLPSQTSQSGKFLTTNGTTASWANVPTEIPSQSGNSGKFLTTNGSAVSWATVNALPSQSGQSGKFLTTNGSAASWANLPTVDQTYSGTSSNAQSGKAVKQAIDAAVSSTYKPAGSCAFVDKPALSANIVGNVYNISDAFTTTSDFVEGAGKNYPAGTNIVCINTATSGTAVYKWDVLSGFVDLSGYQTTANMEQSISTSTGKYPSSKAVKDGLDTKATDANVVHKTGDETIAGTKTFTARNLVIETNSDAGGAGLRVLNKDDSTKKTELYQYTTSDGTYYSRFMNTSYGKSAYIDLTINSEGKRYLGLNAVDRAIVVQPTEDTTSSSQVDTVGARNTKIQSSLKAFATEEGALIPNFDQMNVVQTIEFDTSDTSWHTIFTRTNTETAHSALDDILYFRMTVTGTNINHICDCVVRFEGRLDLPTLVAFLKPGTVDVNYCGIRYARFIYPKALNNGYDWSFEVIQNRNSNARHYKIEVFKTNSKITWTQGTASIYNSTYHNANQSGFETNCGYHINYFSGNITQSSWASAVNSYLNKYVIFGTSPQVGEAILANQMVYMSGNKFYPATNKTNPIEPGCGIQFCNTAYAVNNAIGWDRIRQKSRINSLTNIPHATLARGNPCYFRCTMDSSGNILSDNYVTTSMENGYTWYYLGVAEDANNFCLDTTQSLFLTLDSNGNLTHINGKKCQPASLTASKALVSDANGQVSASSVTSTELSCLSGVTSAVQTQINGKQATITGAATTITTSNLTANKVVVSDGSGKIAISSVGATNLGYLSNVTSDIQTQINGKQATISGGASTITTSNLTASRALVSNSSGKVAVSDITATELGYLDNVTSNIQTQLNGKQATLTSANAGNGITITNQVISETYPLAWEQVSESSDIPEFNVHVYWGNIDGTLSDQTDLNNALSAKANDNAVVHTSGQETVAGNKSFTGSCTATAPSASASTSTTYIATTGWVNDPTKSTNVVHRSGNETIAGTKTFTSVIQGTAYNAYYGDLAECYETDKCYPKGTLVAFGGTKELTIATNEVNAVISSDPGYVLNKKDDENYQPIALIGRVPVRIIGKVEKFDYIVLCDDIPGVAKATKDKNAANIIGRALESSLLTREKLIECSIKLAI